VTISPEVFNFFAGAILKKITFLLVFLTISIWAQIPDSIYTRTVVEKVSLDNPSYLQPGNYLPSVSYNAAGRSIVAWTFNHDISERLIGYKYFSESGEVLFERGVTLEVDKNIKEISTSINENGVALVSYLNDGPAYNLKVDVLDADGNYLLKEELIYSSGANVSGIQTAIYDSKFAIGWFVATSPVYYYVATYDFEGNEISGTKAFNAGSVQPNYNSTLKFDDYGDLFIGFTAKSNEYRYLTNKLSNGQILLPQSTAIFSSTVNFYLTYDLDENNDVWVFRTSKVNGFNNLVVQKYNILFNELIDNYDMEIYSQEALVNTKIFAAGDIFHLFYFREVQGNQYTLEYSTVDTSGVFTPPDSIENGGSEFYNSSLSNVEGGVYFYQNVTNANATYNMLNFFSYDQMTFTEPEIITTNQQFIRADEIEYTRTSRNQNCVVFNRLIGDTTVVKMQIVDDDGAKLFVEPLMIYTSNANKLSNTKVTEDGNNNLFITFAEHLSSGSTEVKGVAYNLNSSIQGDPVLLFTGSGNQMDFHYEIISHLPNEFSFVYGGSDSLVHFNHYNTLTKQLGEEISINVTDKGKQVGLQSFSIDKDDSNNIYIFWKGQAEFISGNIWVQVIDKNFDLRYAEPVSIFNGRTPFRFKMIAARLIDSENILIFGSVDISFGMYSFRVLEATLSEGMTGNWYLIENLELQNDDNNIEVKLNRLDSLVAFSYYDYYNWVDGRLQFYKPGYGKIGEPVKFEDSPYYFYDYRKSYIKSDTIYTVFGCWDKLIYNMMPSFKVETFEILHTTGIEIIEQPKLFSLGQNYPNPFNPATTIKYQMAEEGRVKLTIINILGEMVREINMGIQGSGEHHYEFSGEGLSSGVYFYKLEVNTENNGGEFTSVKKMLYLK